MQKHFLEREMDKLKQMWPLMLIAFLVFLSLPRILEMNARAQVVATPFADYLEYTEYRPANHCTDDTVHQVLLEREVKQTDIGWPAKLTIEMGLRTGSAWGRYDGIVKQEVFYEVLPPKTNQQKIIFYETRTNRPGVYRYETYTTLSLPHGVEKQNNLPLISTAFEVRDCSDMTAEERTIFKQLPSTNL